MMNKIALLISIGLFSCGTKSGSDNLTQASSDSLQTIGSKEKDYRPKPLDYAKAEIELRDTSQFYVVSIECAITITPDTSWIKQQQKSMTEKDWHELVADKQYYQSHAIDTLQQLEIPVHYRLGNKRYIKFEKDDNSTFIIDKTKMNDSWGLILFNGHDNPVIWSSTTIIVAIRDVYKR